MIEIFSYWEPKLVIEEYSPEEDRVIGVLKLENIGKRPGEYLGWATVHGIYWKIYCTDIMYVFNSGQKEFIVSGVLSKIEWLFDPANTKELPLYINSAYSEVVKKRLKQLGSDTL